MRKLFLAVVLGVGLAGAAFADPMQPIQIDFGIVSPTGGSISFAGGVNPLVGTNITVDLLVGLNTPLNSGPRFNCIGCLLNFTSGALEGSTATTWDFGGGPNSGITIVGGIDVNGNGILDAGDIPANTVLLTGNFGNVSVKKFPGSPFKIAGAAFLDTKDNKLEALFGLPDLPGWLGNFNISFDATGAPPNGFASTHVFSGDVLNTLPVPPVPEPATLLLLGTGLLGLGGAARRKFKGKKAVN